MKKIKTNYLLIIAILIIELLFSFTLFPINHCSDIYNLFVEGYKDYAINWFVPSGRTVSAIVLNIFDFFKINIDTYIFIMKLFALLFANIAISKAEHYCPKTNKNPRNLAVSRIFLAEWEGFEPSDGF